MTHWGQLTAISPLTLLALLTDSGWTPSREVGPLWPNALRAERAQLAPTLETLLTDLIADAIIPTPEIPADDAARGFTREKNGRHVSARAIEESIHVTAHDNGRSALFFPIDDVLTVAGTSWHPQTADDERNRRITLVDIKTSPLLSRRLVAKLAAEGCDLRQLRPRALLELGEDSTRTIALRAVNALERRGVHHLADIVACSPDDLLCLRNYGPQAYRETIELLRLVLRPWLDELETAATAEAMAAAHAEREGVDASTSVAKLSPSAAPSRSLVPHASGERAHVTTHDNGRSALFFPIDDVLALFGTSWHPSASDDERNRRIALADNIKSSPLLSRRLVAKLAAEGCDLSQMPTQTLLRLGPDSGRTSALRAVNALVRGGLLNLASIVARSPDDLLGLRNYGPHAYRDMIELIRLLLRPWMDELEVAADDEARATLQVDGAGPHTRVTASLPSRLPAHLAVPEVEPAGVTTSESLLGSDLLALLDLYGVPWRDVPACEACAQLPIGPTLDEVINGAQPDPYAQPGQPTWRDIARAHAEDIARNLIGLLVRRVVHAPVRDERDDTSLPDITVERLLWALIEMQPLLAGRSNSANSALRPFEVLFARVGLQDGIPRTLSELGEELDLSRERVRQLASRAEDRLREPDLAPFLRGLALLVTWAIQAEGGLATIGNAARRIGGWLDLGAVHPVAIVTFLAAWAPDVTSEGEPDEGYLITSPYTPSLVRQVQESAVSILNDYPGGVSFERLLDQVMLAVGDEGFSAGRQFVSAAISLCEWIERAGDLCLPNGRDAVKARLFNVFKALGQPTHYKDVAIRFREMYPDDKPRSAESLQNVILRHPDIFVRVGNGIYALAEGRYQTEQTVADALERLLSESNVPLHRTEVIERADSRYHWTENSLSGGLVTNPRIRAFGNGFFGLADRVYHDFDPVQAYAHLFGTSRPVKEHLVQATFTNLRGNSVVQIKLTENVLKGAIPLKSRPLRALMPDEGEFAAEAICSGYQDVMLVLKRSAQELLGFRSWLVRVGVKPGDMLFIERLEGPRANGSCAYRLAYAPKTDLADALRAVGLTPSAGSTAVLDHRVLHYAREPEKLSMIVAHTCTHLWTVASEANTVLGFAPSSPHGYDYAYLGVTSGLLARGHVEHLSAGEIIRPTSRGRGWFAGRHDTAAFLRLSLLALPPYRAHLRARASGVAAASERTSGDPDAPLAVLDVSLAERWDERFQLLTASQIHSALSDTPALVPLAELVGADLCLLLLLTAAHSHGFGISLPAAEAHGLADAGQPLDRLRLLGVALLADDAGQLALAERVTLAFPSADLVRQTLRARPDALAATLAAALASLWPAAQSCLPTTASSLYAALMAADVQLFTALLVPPPSDLDPAIRFADADLIPCGFTPLAADWGWDVTSAQRPPFAFLEHANALMRGYAVAPAAICLCEELLAQPWDAPRALAANAHLALLTLIAGDVGGLAGYLAQHDDGWAYHRRPLVPALDEALRQLGYDVCDEAYRDDPAAQAALGHSLIALGTRLDLFRPSEGALESDSPLATQVYYGAYDVLARMQDAVKRAVI